MSEKPVREHDKFMLRLPEGLRDKLKHSAALNKRSMNAEIIARIESTIGGELNRELFLRDPQALVNRLDYIQSGFDYLRNLIEKQYNLPDELRAKLSDE